LRLPTSRHETRHGTILRIRKLLVRHRQKKVGDGRTGRTGRATGRPRRVDGTGRAGRTGRTERDGRGRVEADGTARWDVHRNRFCDDRDVATPAGLIAVHVLSETNGSETRPWLICHLCDERPNAITEYAMVEQLAEQSVKAVRSIALDECDPPSQYMP